MPTLMQPKFQVLPAFVQDQVLSPMVAQIIWQNQAYLFGEMGQFHFNIGSAIGCQNDPLMPRCVGSIMYQGTFGAGGNWVAEAGSHGFSVGNLPADTRGRGRVTFLFYGSTFQHTSNATYAVLLQASDNSGSGLVHEVVWFNRTTNHFDFSFRESTAGGVWSEVSINTYTFSMALYASGVLA